MPISVVECSRHRCLNQVSTKLRNPRTGFRVVEEETKRKHWFCSPACAADWFARRKLAWREVLKPQ